MIVEEARVLAAEVILFHCRLIAYSTEMLAFLDDQFWFLLAFPETLVFLSFAITNINIAKNSIISSFCSNGSYTHYYVDVMLSMASINC